MEREGGSQGREMGQVTQLSGWMSITNSNMGSKEGHFDPETVPSVLPSSDDDGGSMQVRQVPPIARSIRARPSIPPPSRLSLCRQSHIDMS